MAGNDKHWIKGSAKIKKFEPRDWKKWATVVNLSLSLEDLKKCAVSDKWYIYIDLYKKPEKDQYDNDFSISESDYWREKLGAPSDDDDLDTDDGVFGEEEEDL